MVDKYEAVVRDSTMTEDVVTRASELQDMLGLLLRVSVT
jgi:hypothetical protein